MIDTTRTTTLLLEGLHDASNDAAWREFDARYRPIIIAFARKLGLSDADANDVAQETLVRFIEEYRANKYDRSRARLGSWIVGIARYRIAGVYRKRERKRESRGESAMFDMSDDVQMTQVWGEQRRRVILQHALNELRTNTKLADHTIRAFEMHVLQQMPVAAVAEELSLTAQEVYLAKSRVAGKLREVVTKFEDAYDEDA